MGAVRTETMGMSHRLAAPWEDSAIERLGDDELLDRVVAASGDGGGEAEAAFRAIVARHGPMVLGVCRHILDQVQDAEDAFQATFLVLARNAGTIRDRRVLGSWLYEVAYRVALRSRARTSRRRTQEREAAEMAAVGHRPGSGSGGGKSEDPAWNELRPVLHEEVNRLPEKYRSAVVLCYLEGHTHEEAAELLRWPVGTVKGRLSRARELLRSRLTRRGLALSATFLAARLSENTVFAEVVPVRLADATSRRALAFAREGDAGLAALDPATRELVDNASPEANARANADAKSRTSRFAIPAVAVAVVVGALLVALYAVLAHGKSVPATPPTVPIKPVPSAAVPDPHVSPAICN